MIDPNDQLVAALAGRYDIERELARGGMAVVYLAQDVRHNRKVAIKVLRVEPQAWLGTDRFEREIAIVSPLVHPNIMPVHDSGEAAGCLYYVMPYVEGPTLRERLVREVQLPFEDAVGIARQVAAALDHAHTHGVIHRDIKPENILLVGDHVLVADFGLARPITSAGSMTLTNRRQVIGTPPYMSPEQCSPGGQLDGRSDIYSLGCVVFEMITGMTPFRAATVDVMMVHHLTSEPPSICIDRSSCPPELDDAVRRALAKVPADRFRTAGEFAAALERSLQPGTSSDRRNGHPAASSARARRRRVAALTAGTALVVALIAWLLPRGGWGSGPPDVARDTTVIALLPMERQGISAEGPEDQVIFEAFRRWRGITVVDEFLTRDAIRQLGRPVGSDEDARHVAEALGAGRYVRGRLTGVGDSARAYLTLYDVRSREPLHQEVAHLAADQKNADSVFADLTEALLLRGARGSGARAAYGHRSLPAIQAFATGERYLTDWDLSRADSSFRLATNFEPDYALAHLRLAQVRAWRHGHAAPWLDAAQRALDGPTRLSSRDSLLASALVGLATGRYGDACRRYDELRRRNDRDFAAWYGLGQCRTLDKLVVADTNSPSRWRFRSSFHQASQAYARALELFPSVHRGLLGEPGDPLSGVSTLLLTGRDQLTSGRAADSALFLARLGWANDTILLVPYPYDRVTGGESIDPPGFEQAVQHQREVFRRIATTWSTSLPQAAGAKEALALSLEMLGDHTSADTLRAARALTTDPIRRVQLAAAEVLIRVKFALPSDLAEIRRARMLADSILGLEPITATVAAQALVPIAELTGRCHRAARLARSTPNEVTSALTLPRQYREDAVTVIILLAAGCDAEPGMPTLSQLSDRIRRDPAFATPERRKVADDRLLVGAAQFMFPPDSSVLTRLTVDGEASLLGAARSIVLGNLPAARTALENVSGHRRGAPAWADAAYPEARLWLMVGDTAQALTILDNLLDGIRQYSVRSFAVPGRTASLVRAMALRAELERARNASERARIWSGPVAELWINADQEVRPMVRRMQRLARPD